MQSFHDKSKQKGKTCLAEHINQHNQRRDQIIPDPLLQVHILMTKDQKNIIVMKGLKIQIQNSQDSSRDKQI